MKAFRYSLSGFRFPRGLGHDVSGVVEAAGPGVERLAPGDAVFGATAIPKAGAFAEYVVADEKNVGFKPPTVSFEQAAAMMVVGMTAWNGLVATAKLKAGQLVFVNGYLGGVGRAVAAHRAHACQNGRLPAVLPASLGVRPPDVARPGGHRPGGRGSGRGLEGYGVDVVLIRVRRGPPFH